MAAYLPNFSVSRDGNFQRLKTLVSQRLPVVNTTTLSTTYPPGAHEEGSLVYNSNDSTVYVRTPGPAWTALSTGASNWASVLTAGNSSGGTNPSLDDSVLLTTQTVAVTATDPHMTGGIVVAPGSTAVAGRIIIDTGAVNPTPGSELTNVILGQTYPDGFFVVICYNGDAQESRLYVRDRTAFSFSVGLGNIGAGFSFDLSFDYIVVGY